MTKKLPAFVAAMTLLASNAVCAAADWGWGYDYNDYGYDYNYDYNYDYGYDNTWDNGQTWGTDTSAADGSSADSQPDSANNAPVTASFTLSNIVEKKFTADLKIDSLSKITGIDLTITYDPAVLKLTDSKANKKAGGTGAAAELEAGTIQYQYTNKEGSQWKESYLTLSFEVIDPSMRSTVIYMTANSVLNEYSTPLTARTDGTIVQIEGAVEFDAKDDESMYSELRVTKSAAPISYETLGLADVASVTFENPAVASTTGNAITTLSTGLTNMTVEFGDGTKKYFRLVVSESAPAPVTTAAGTVAVPDAAAGQQTAPADPGAAAPAVTDVNGAAVAAQTAALPADQGVIKTETRSSSRVKYLIIYILVLVALIALVVEFFVFFGNPYSKSFALLKKGKPRRVPVTGDIPNPAPDSEPDPGVPDTLTLDNEDEGEYDGGYENDNEGEDKNLPFLETDENTSGDDAYEEYEESPYDGDDEEYDDSYEEYEDSSAVYGDPDTEQPDDSTGYDTADDAVYYDEDGEIVDDEDDGDGYEYDDEEFEEDDEVIEEDEDDEYEEDEDDPEK